MNIPMQPNNIETDVLVMGAGLAGISAAIAAAQAGARVCLLSSSALFSGSSFYPGTWGLGLIAPEHEQDAEDLIRAITTLGEGMVVPQLVETLVGDIQMQIDRLEAMGCQLKRPQDSGQREYIPCFDYKARNWYGIAQKQSVQALAQQLRQLGITALPDTEVVGLGLGDGQVRGAAALGRNGDLTLIQCGAVVLAGGGMGGLFRHRLNTSDITGVGQYLALQAGATLINTEFYQMFLGFAQPAPKTIYNEKLFRYTQFLHTGTHRSIFERLTPQREAELLEQRSTHGPFTARLADRELDRLIFEALRQHELGVEISYSNRLKELNPLPEFVETYFEWLKEHKHLTMDDNVRLGMFFHASNGGILIDTHGSTGVPGLFACGECTGGMHGADRIGGLSTANCLVFGNRAGAAAAQAAANASPCPPLTLQDFHLPAIIPGAAAMLEELRQLNSNTLMVVREQRSLEAAARRRAQLRQRADHAVSPPNLSKIQELRTSLHLRAALTLTDCIQQAALLRQESRGSHYRTDFPQPNQQLARCILCSGTETIHAAFAEPGFHKPCHDS